MLLFTGKYLFDDYLTVFVGKNIMNWMISSFIFAIASCILILVGVGILMIIALVICSFIFTIMGAVNASNGKVFKYPLAIEFIK
jgi:uncharacterized Tic20 family protein